MRHWITAGVLVALIAVVLMIQLLLDRSIRGEFSREKASGELPGAMKDWNPDDIDLSHLGKSEFADKTMVRRLVSECIRSWWFIWVPLIMVACAMVDVCCAFRCQPKGERRIALLHGEEKSR